MVAGPLLKRAIAELAALGASTHERAVASPILPNLQHSLGTKPNWTPEEQELIVTIQEYWEEAREEGLEAGRDEGLEAGRAEAAARAVLTALRVRGLAVTDAVRERILAQEDPERLQRWHERAIVAASIDEVLEEPS